MKKLIMLSLLVINFHISQVWADITSELQKRLNKINSFYANFTQKVISIDGDLIQQGEGQVWIKRPNLFNWHMVSPDESWLVSDGTNLWFYNSFIEQVTITLLSDVITDSPLILITRNDSQYWKRYEISQNGNDFKLKSSQNHGNLKRFLITIMPDGIIKKFTVVEHDGQMSVYQFKYQQNSLIDDNKFHFSPPKNITIDDQRISK